MSKSYFTTKKLVTLAILSALGSGLMWFEIPFIQPFKIDPSDSAVIVGAVLYGPIGAAIIAAIKALIHFIFLSSGDFGIGEFIAFTASMAYTIPFYLTMKLSRKLIKSEILIRLIPAAVGTLALSVILPILNLLVFYQLWSYVMFNQFMAYDDILVFSIATIPGNLVKGGVLSFIFIILSFRLNYVAERLQIIDEEQYALLLSE